MLTKERIIKLGVILTFYKRPTIVLILLLMINIFSVAQDKMDTIYTYEKTIIGKVDEVNDREILYILSKEDVKYRIYKGTVIRIAFSSGRIELFNKRENLDIIHGSNDWSKVLVTSNPEDIKGMMRVDMISVKAKGATFVSGVVQTQNRAFRKLKYAAAMLGGNVVFVNNQLVEGNILGLRSTLTQLTGTVYSVLKDTAGLVKNLKNHRFVLHSKKEMKINSGKPFYSWDIYKPISVDISEPNFFEFKNGLVYLNLDIQEPVKKFILLNQTSTYFVVGYHYKSRFAEIRMNISK